MAISFTCFCGRTIAAPDEQRGRTFHCPYCGADANVPDPLAGDVDEQRFKLACPRCGAMREPGDTSCVDCGMVYGALPTKKLLGPAPEPAVRPFGIEAIHAFVYPLAPGGLFLIVVTAVAIAGLVRADLFREPSDTLIVLAALAGWFAYFLLDIVQTSAGGQREFPIIFQKPEWTHHETLLLALLAVFFSALPLIFGAALVVGGILAADHVPWIILGSLTCLYLPASLLSVAIWRSAEAVSPHVVIPALLKVPLPMLTASVVMAGGALIHYMLVDAGLEGSSPGFVVLFAANAAAVYLYFVSARIIGITHWVYRERIGWFADGVEG